MKNAVNISLQIIPVAKSLHPYDIIDRAIEVIKASGLKFKVCPMETVIEGDFDKIMATIDKAIKTAYSLSDQLFVNIKMQIDKNQDVSMDEKLKKYS